LRLGTTSCSLSAESQAFHCHRQTIVTNSDQATFYKQNNPLSYRS
jgi:hypothetical protein